VFAAEEEPGLILVWVGGSQMVGQLLATGGVVRHLEAREADAHFALRDGFAGGIFVELEALGVAHSRCEGEGGRQSVGIFVANRGIFWRAESMANIFTDSRLRFGLPTSQDTNPGRRGGGRP
jgi:hypothetical protein